MLQKRGMWVLVLCLVAVGLSSMTLEATGRWKIGATCYFDANDSGPDQCSPTSGRWKISGANCYWDPNDSGPNQCEPFTLLRGEKHAAVAPDLNTITGTGVSSVPAPIAILDSHGLRDALVRASERLPLSLGDVACELIEQDAHQLKKP